jgi:hypothetical protein
MGGERTHIKVRGGEGKLLFVFLHDIISVTDLVISVTSSSPRPPPPELKRKAGD